MLAMLATLAVCVLWLSCRKIKHRGSGFRLHGHAMQRPRSQFTISRLMSVVAAAALLLAPISWVNPDRRFAMMILGGKLFLVVIAGMVAWRLPPSEKLPPCAATAERRRRAQSASSG